MTCHSEQSEESQVSIFCKHEILRLNRESVAQDDKKTMDTIFDKIIRKEIPAEILYEDDHVIVFLDIFPVNPGHTLFVPKEVSENMMQTQDASLAHLLSVVKKLAPAILSAVGATDFNFTTNNGPAAGQIVMHTHFHFIPRFVDDGYKMWGHKDSTKEQREELQNKIIERIS